MATAFVRGKWGNTKIGGSSFLMAKCCHDLDLLTWFKAGSHPLKVSSFGRRTQFRADKAPAGAGTRCLTDCEIEESCAYSAKKLYLDQPLWGGYVWPDHIHGIRLEPEQKRKLIETVCHIARQFHTRPFDRLQGGCFPYGGPYDDDRLEGGDAGGVTVSCPVP